MFAGFTGFYGEMRLQGFQIYRDCGLQANPAKNFKENNKKCREYDATWILWGFLFNSYRIYPQYPCSDIFPALFIVFPQDFLQVLPVTSNPYKFEIPAP